MNQNIGELLAIVAALCGAASSILYNRLGSETGSDILAYTRMLIAVPIMCLYAFIADGIIVNAQNLNQVINLLISGVIGFFITDLFMFRAYVSWGARETMVVMCLAPVLSTIFAFMLFNEKLTARQLAGSLCSVLGIVIMVLGQKKNEEVKRATKEGIIFAFLAAFLQSVADMTAKGALNQMPWVTSAAIRAFGGVVAWIIYGFFKRKTLFVNKQMVLKPRFLTVLTFTVLVGTVLGTTLAMGALKYAPAGIVTSLKQISPIFILPYEALVLKRKLRHPDIIGTLVSVFGIFLIF